MGRRRTAERDGIEMTARMRLAEADLDSFERSHAATIAELRDEMRAAVAELRRVLNRLLWAVVGLLISVTTSVIVWAAMMGVGQ